MPDSAPPTDPGPAPRRLRRSTEDRDLAGVLGGLGDALDVESSWLRLAVVAATGFLAFGIGDGAQLLVVLPYAAAWALLPTDGARPLLLQIPRRAALQELGLIALLVVVSTVVALQPGLSLVAVLGGAAALLLRDRAPAEVGSATAGSAPTAFAPAPPIGSDGTTVAPTTAATADHPDPAGTAPMAPGRRRPPPRPRREPALWPLAAGLIAVVGVIVAAGLVAGWVVDVRLVVNLLLAVVGGVMALSAWRGRARVLLLLCPVLLLLWFATSAADIGGHDGLGRRRENPTATSSTGTLSYEMGYGVLQVDLTGLELESGSRTELDVGVSMGLAQVTVPAGARVVVTGEVGLGAVDLPTQRWGDDFQPSAHRDLDLRREPIGPSCEIVPTSAAELWRLARDAGVDIPPPSRADDGDEPANGPTPTNRPDGTDAPEASEPTVDGLDPTDPSTIPGPTVDVGRDEDGAPRRVDDALLDAVEEAGFPRPRVLAPITGDDGNGPVTEDQVAVHLTDQWALCMPQPPDPDPPVVVIDATIGFGALEVHRV